MPHMSVADAARGPRGDASADREDRDGEPGGGIGGEGVRHRGEKGAAGGTRPGSAGAAGPALRTPTRLAPMTPSVTKPVREKVTTSPASIIAIAPDRSMRFHRRRSTGRSPSARARIVFRVSARSFGLIASGDS